MSSSIVWSTQQSDSIKIDEVQVQVGHCNCTTKTMSLAAHGISATLARSSYPNPNRNAKNSLFIVARRKEGV